MKKILLVITLITLVASTAFSQLGITKGVKGGLSFATMGGPDASKITQGLTLGTNTSFAAGAFLRFDILGFLAIQPEVLYSVKGAKITGSLTVFSQKIDITSTTTLNYVEIPILVKAYLPIPGPLKLGVFAGPAVGFFLNGKTKTEATGFPTDEQDAKEISGQDFGVVFGAGADVNLVVVSLTIDVRYGLGLKTIDASSSNYDVKNQVVSVMVGVGF